MKRSASLAMIFGGYVVAGILAGIVVRYSPNANGPGGMAAFGDLLHFAAVFCVVASVPTGYALWLLRGHQTFWNVLAILAVAFAPTGIVAAIANHLAPGIDASSAWYSWVQLSPLRILAAPGLFGAFGLAGMLAPARRARLALFAGASVELAVAVYSFSYWLGQSP